MAIDNRWWVRDRVILQTLSNIVTEADWQYTNLVLFTLLERYDEHPIDFLVDAEHLQLLPQMRQLLAADWLAHPNLGWLVVYKSDIPEHQTMLSIMSHVFGFNLHFAASQADALQFLERVHQRDVLSTTPVRLPVTPI